MKHFMNVLFRVPKSKYDHYKTNSLSIFNRNATHEFKTTNYFSYNDYIKK